MTQRATPSTVRFDPTWLGPLALAADPVADQLIGELMQDVAAGDRRQALPSALARIGAPSATKKDPVTTFVSGGAELDAVVAEHREHIERAQRYFDDNGVAVITALFHAALPQAYLGRRGVQVLDATGELTLNWTRRVQETGQFLVNVLSPTPELWREGRTSLTAGEFGARAARRVRLVHAAIRWMLDDPPAAPLPSLLLRGVDQPTEWTRRLILAGHEVEDGEQQPPINQQDLLATLGTFTTIVFRALDQLAVPYEPDDREAFHALWNIVGWHLGIGNDAAVPTARPRPAHEPAAGWPGNSLLPIGADEMDAVYDHLAALLQGPTDAGKRMAKALVEELAYPLPRPLQGAPAFVVRYLVGAARADDLEIEEGGFIELVIAHTGALNVLTSWARTGPAGRAALGVLSRTVTRYAIRAFIAQARWSERGLSIDPRVAGKWGIDLPPSARNARP